MIKIIIFDVDGTLTDGKIYIGNSGEAFKAFSVKDGYAITKILPQNQITPIILTARNSKIVQQRCQELGIKNCIQGCSDKQLALTSIAKQFNISCDEQGVFKEIAYMGDDIPDETCMKKCGLTGCPSDAVDSVKTIANYVTTKLGGAGAAREFVEWVIEQNYE